MMPWLAAAFLFWPATAIMSGSIFLIILVGFFLVAGGIVLFTLLLYGIYAALRDSGLLDFIIRIVNDITDKVIESLRGNIRQSFKVQVEEKSGGPRIYACSPHGMYGISWAIHLCTGLTDWPKDVPKPKLAVHSVFFKIPFVREFMLSRNCIPATETTIVSEIEKGNSVALIIGGIEELYQTKTGKINLVIDKRKGYIRLAKKTNIPIQPLLTIGENDLFPFSDNAVWKNFEKFLYDWFHIALPLPTLSSLKRWMSIVYSPLDKPCTTYFLKSVQTENKSEEDIRKNHKDCLKDFSKRTGHSINFIG